MSDELDAPLGAKKQPRKRLKLPFDLSRWPITRMVFGLLVLIFIGLAARVILVDDPEGGRPIAEVAIAAGPGVNQVADQVATIVEDQPPEVATTQIEEQPGGPSITIIGDDVPDDLVGNVGVAALTDFGVLPDLIEETQNGPIPQIGPQGDTPFGSYARASISPASAGGKPLIAVIITGMGLSESQTLDAIEKLPDDVTLSFAPYSRSLQRTTAAARAGGHELVLELPLEPFDYPENDPGPQTLLTSEPPRANLDKLFWLMARMGGYTAMINHMGARFTASATDFAPVMEELATRGLGYIDDGSSNRSVAQNLAATNKVAFTRADVQLDETISRAGILEALEELEAEAKANGQAVGVASALPVSIDTIAEWARDVEDRDIFLVPISALMKNR